MPELPEVETIRRGLSPYLEGEWLQGAQVRHPQLRWPIPPELPALLRGRQVYAVRRRAKYLLLELQPTATLLIHLGMSGSLRIVPSTVPPERHDHVDLLLAHDRLLRLRDPRRFGALLWTEAPPEAHPRLVGLGPEPLGPGFHGNHLYLRSRGRRQAVKGFLMDGATVAGIGNIYANEACFLAGIHPGQPAGRVGRKRYRTLVRAVRTVLEAAIEAGGTTLQDFAQSDGTPGYFRQQLRIYGQNQAPCPSCATAICSQVIGQRASYFCPNCQR